MLQPQRNRLRDESGRDGEEGAARRIAGKAPRREHRRHPIHRAVAGALIDCVDHRLRAGACDGIRVQALGSTAVREAGEVVARHAVQVGPVVHACTALAVIVQAVA